jgi:Mg2+ and Co2+ transporter CorA
MSNHIHGIIVINDREKASQCLAPTKENKKIGYIIGQFKSSMAKMLKRDGLNYDIWQRNYFEHIIRNEEELYRIQEYIKNNPLKTLQELSLGRSSLNETRDYFNNNRRALTPKQTRQLEGSSQPLQDYQNLQQQRRIDTIAKKLKSLNKENLPQSERIKKFKDLTDQLKKIREGK